MNTAPAGTVPVLPQEHGVFSDGGGVDFEGNGNKGALAGKNLGGGNIKGIEQPRHCAERKNGARDPGFDGDMVIKKKIRYICSAAVRLDPGKCPGRGGCAQCGHVIGGNGAAQPETLHAVDLDGLYLAAEIFLKHGLDAILAAVSISNGCQSVLPASSSPQ